MRVPSIPKHQFLPWADQQFQRIPSPANAAFEAARWQATVDGIPCIVTAYSNDRTDGLRLAVQGVPVSQTKSLTDALYKSYFQQHGRPGQFNGRPKPRRNSGGHYRQGRGRH